MFWGFETMGWTHCLSSPYAVWKNGRLTMPPTSRQKEIDKMLTWESKDKDGNILSIHKVLKSSMVGSTYYAAVTTAKPGKPTVVRAAVFLTCGRVKHDACIWGYKDIDETMHPYYYDCPASILALLTPTDSKCANEWREGCRRKIAERAERRKNGSKPLYAPTGVGITVEGQSWIITSSEFRRRTGYTGIRFTKAKWHESDKAMRAFLVKYGTEGQKKEFAKSGRECPTEWRTSAA